MTDKEKIREARNAYARNYRKNNPDKVKMYNDRHFLKKFNELSEPTPLDKAIINNDTATPATPIATLESQIIELKNQTPDISNREIARRLNTNDNKVRRVLNKHHV